MRTNGTLRYRMCARQGQFDEDGQPVAADPVWSEPVRCFIRTNTHDNKGVGVGGTFTHEAYEVLIERIPGGIDTDTVRLVRDRKNLGEFKVQDIQVLCLDRIRIIV